MAIITTLLAFAIAAFAPALARAAAPNPLPLPGSSFQAADGDQLKTATLTDWETYADTAPGTGIATTVVDGVSPDTFFKGKINEPDAWTLDSAGTEVTPGKANAQASSTFRDPLTAKLFFYFSFIRADDSNSETLYGLELRKVTTTWTNTAGATIPCRSNGDILFTYNVQPNTKNVTIEAFRWTSAVPGPAACPEGKVGTYSPVTLGINAQGYMNFDGAITNFIRRDVFTSSLAKGRFGEGAINLTDTLGAGANPCFSFGQAQFYSLSSGGSFSSAMQDTIAPVGIDVRNCSASGTKWRDDDADGVKDAGEPGIAGWTFWVDYDDDGVVDANEPSGVSDAAGKYTISNINPTASGYDKNGIYRIHEKAPAGVTGYTCSSPNATTVGGGTDGHGCYWAATFATSGNQTGFDFGNVPPGRIVIKKTNVGGTQTDEFAFTATGLTPTSFGVAASDADGDEFTPVVPNAGGTHVSSNTYTVTEDATGQPAGYRLTNLVCDDSDSTESLQDRRATIRVSPGETVTCTFTNRKDASLTVRKLVSPDTDTTDFGFTLRQAGSQTDIAPFPASLGHGDTQTASVSADGATDYVFTETLDSGFDLTSIACVDTVTDEAVAPVSVSLANGTVTVRPAAGQRIRCDFTNRKKAELTVSKITLPDGDPQTFSFALTQGGTSVGAPFPASLKDGDPAVGKKVSADGSTAYVFTETQNSGYSLTDISCFDASAPATALTVPTDLAAGTVTVTPEAGQEIACRFTNTKKGRVTIVKDAIDDAAQDFAFIPGGVLTDPTFLLDDDGDAGVDKSDTKVFSGLTTFGTATIRETQVTDWDLELIACVDAAGAPVAAVKYGTVANGAFTTGAADASKDGFQPGDDTVEIDVQPGVDATCTFTNKKVALNVNKLAVQTTPVSAGDEVGFTVQTTNAGPGTARDVTMTDALPAGVTWAISAQTDQAAPLECAIAGPADAQVLTCGYGDLVAGASRSVTVTATTGTTADACKVFDNTANVIADNASPDSDDASVSCLRPDVEVSKTPDSQSVNAGDALEFQVVTTNNGPGVARDVTLTDDLPSGVTWSIDPAVAGCSITSGTLTCAFGDLADDASRTVTVKATAGTTAESCKVFDNSATATPTNGPGDTDAGQITCLRPDVEVSKTPDSQSVNAGDGLEFQVVTTNNGPGVARDVTLTDDLPTGVTWSIDPAVAGCSITAGTLTCAFGDLADDASRTVTVKATAGTTAESCKVFDNSATATPTNGAGDTDAGQITCLRPALDVAKTPDAQSVNAGDALAFQIVTTNDGPGVARDVTLTDDLPAGVTWSIGAQSDQSDPFECAITGAPGSQQLDCAYGDLADDASRTVTVTATAGTTAESCKVFDNSATAATTNGSGDTDAGQITCLRPDVEVSKTPDAQSVNAGDALAFQVVTTNNGPGVARDVTLTDDLPTGVTWSIDPAVAGCSITAGTLTCAFGDLADDASRTVTVKATAGTTAESCKVFDNSATATPTNGAGDTDAGRITCLRPDVEVSKTPDSQSVNAGDGLEFQVVTTNNGPGVARDVTLTDDLPSGVTWSIGSQSDQSDPFECAITGAPGSQQLDCSYGDLADDASRTVTVTATAGETAESCKVFDNSATATPTNGPGDTDAGRITCVRPDLGTEKAALSVTVDAGDDVSFTMTTRNRSGEDVGVARGVTLSDPLPAGVTWTIAAQTDTTAPLECSISGPANAQVLDCAYGDLASGEERAVTVTAKTAYDKCAVYDNEATADATNAPAVSDSDSITCNRPSMSIAKTTATPAITGGDVAMFQVTVQNTGPGVAKNVVVEDLLPAGVTWTADGALPAGCAIADVTLDGAARQKVTCSYTSFGVATVTFDVKAQTTVTACDTYVNDATLAGSNFPTGSASATVVCTKPNPRIAIDKVGPATAIAGDTLTFAMAVSNPGPTAFPEGQLALVDQKCNAGTLALTTKNGDLTPGTLDPGDTWSYLCLVSTAAGETSVTNVATINGTDVNGKPASATDDATTVLNQPVAAQAPTVVPAPIPGTSRLRGPSGCLRNANSRVYVTGRQIQSVRFVLDGKTYRTVRKRDKQGRWMVTIKKSRVRTGSHRVQAVVTYKAASQTKRRTLQIRFSKCSAVLPSRAKGLTG